jgi:hypothetical protein
MATVLSPMQVTVATPAGSDERAAAGSMRGVVVEVLVPLAGFPLRGAEVRNWRRRWNFCEVRCIYLPRSYSNPRKS